MKLKTISARNFKGQTFTLDLAAVNFLVGANFAGKTARADAIRLLLLGYLPELGKTNAATFGLASGREMGVSGFFDDGSTMHRTWRAVGSSIKEEFDVTGPVAEWPDGVVGNLAVMLDANTYFALSDRARVAYVFANVDLGGSAFSQGSVYNSILDAVERSRGTDPRGDGSGTAAHALVGKIKTKAAEDEMSPQEFVEAALALATEETKAAKATAVTMEKTAQGLAHLRSLDEPGATLAAVETKARDLAAEIADLNQKKGSATEAARDTRRTKERRAVLTVDVSRKARYSGTRTATATRLEEVRRRLGELTVATEEALETLRDEDRAAASGLRDLEKDHSIVLANISRNLTEKTKMFELDKCPCCGATGTNWRDGKIAEIDSALAGLEVKRDQLTKQIATVREHAEAKLKQLNETKFGIDIRRTLITEERTLALDLQTAEDSLARIEAAETELASLPPEDSSLLAEVDTIQTALNVKADELRRLEGEKRTLAGRVNDLRRLAEAEKARDNARIEEAVAKVAADALRTVQANMVERAFEPLLARANSFAPDVLKTPLAYKDGEIGTTRDGVWVSHATFSGIEKLVTYAAIQAALSATAPVRVMILDEMLRAQNTRALAAFDLLVAACKRAVATGFVEQFVGIIPGEAPTYAVLSDSTSQVVEIA